MGGKTENEILCIYIYLNEKKNPNKICTCTIAPFYHNAFTFVSKKQESAQTVCVYRKLMCKFHFWAYVPCWNVSK